MLLFLLVLASPVWCSAQNLPVVMLSDLHFDPLRDPGKAARLAEAPVAGWAAILREPATPTQAADFAAIQEKCGSRNGLDADFALMNSALGAASPSATHPRFVTVSGDLVVHQFECRWKLATGHNKGFEDFAEKTANFVIRQVEADFPGIPVYVALGNNDSSCGDYRLDLHDRFLEATSESVVKGLVGASAQERRQAQADYRTGGFFYATLPGLRKTRLLVVDDIYLSRKYKTCGGKEDAAESAVVLKWLANQLDAARRQGEAVWFMAHIPPGVDVYSTVAKKRNVCGGEAPEMFLADDSLPVLLAQYPETLRLALFGHTHNDEVRLIGQVPARLVASVTGVNGNLSSYTLALVNRSSARMVDSSITMGGRAPLGVWFGENDYRDLYGAQAFTGVSLGAAIDGFGRDPESAQPASQAYERHFAPGLPSPVALVWPQAVCALGNLTVDGYRGCVCRQ